MRLRSLDFEAWVAHCFDHPAEGPEWYFDLESDVWDAPSALTLEHLTRLFEDPAPPLAGYSDAQVNQGLWYIVSNACSNHMFALSAAEVPVPERQRCMAAISGLYTRLFAVRCSPELSHGNKSSAQSPLNLVCYMFWDLLPYGPAAAPAQKPIDEAALAVMRGALALPSLACQESALHGLGHWACGYPDEVARAIDAYLASAAADPRLRSYAQSARTGCVL